MSNKLEQVIFDTFILSDRITGSGQGLKEYLLELIEAHDDNLHEMTAEFVEVWIKPNYAIEVVVEVNWGRVLRDLLTISGVE